MSKSLKTIQTFANIARIVSKVMFVISIVGAVIITVGCICIAAGLGSGTLFNFGSVAIKGLIPEVDLEPRALIFECVSAVVTCIAEAVVCYFSKEYFENEISVGTPFTFQGAEEIKRLGIISIVLPIVAQAISGIIYGIAIKNQTITPPDTDGTIIFGVMFIAFSFIFKYGAEIKENSHAEN